MNPDLLAALIALGVSALSSTFVAGLFWGGMKARIAMTENALSNMATKEQLAGVKEDVAEIKGMFRMTLRSERDGA